MVRRAQVLPGLSPATDLAVRTIDMLTFGWIPGHISLILLATLETVIGVGFLTGRYMRLTLALLVFQMAGSLTPLALFSGEAFMVFPYAPTMVSGPQGELDWIADDEQLEQDHLARLEQTDLVIVCAGVIPEMSSFWTAAEHDEKAEAVTRDIGGMHIR